MPAARTAPPSGHASGAHAPQAQHAQPQQPQQQPVASSSRTGSSTAHEKSAAETLAQRREQNKLAQRRFRERAREAKRASRSQQGAGPAPGKAPYVAPSPPVALDSRSFNKWLGALGVPETLVPPSFFVPPAVPPFDAPSLPPTGSAPTGMPAGYAAAAPIDGMGKEWQDPEVVGDLPASSQWDFANVPPSMSPGFYPFVAPNGPRASVSGVMPLGAEGYASLLSQPFVPSTGALHTLPPSDAPFNHPGAPEPFSRAGSSSFVQQRGQPAGAFSAGLSQAGTSDGSDGEGRVARRPTYHSAPFFRNDSDSSSTLLSVKREQSTDGVSSISYGSEAPHASSSRAAYRRAPPVPDEFHPELPQASRYIALLTWTSHLRNLGVDDYMRFLRTPLPTAPRALGLENHDVVRVLLMNAQAMGFVRETFHEYDAVSDIGDSFRRMQISEQRRSSSASRRIEAPSQRSAAESEELADPETHAAVTRWRRIPKHMHPTKLQLTIPHHPWIDVGFPWPALRDRILTLTEARLLDEDELCADMILPGSYDGEQPSFIVWGNDALDDRAWEMSEGFAQRWPMLIDEEMIKTTNFWRKQRGLDPLPMPESAPHDAAFGADPRISELDDDDEAPVPVQLHRPRHSA